MKSFKIFVFQLTLDPSVARIPNVCPALSTAILSRSRDLENMENEKTGRGSEGSRVKY